MPQRNKLKQLWGHMKQRCYNPNNKAYKHYGARGIYVCNRWLESSDNFIKDMGPRPIGFELDRINNDGPYSPENCRWSSRSTQMINTRTRKDNVLGIRNIRLIDGCYVVRMNRNGIYHSPKSFKSLEEALEFRDFLKEHLDGS